MRRHTLLMGALAIGAMAIGCGGNRENGGTQGAAGTSGSTNVPGGSAMTLRGCVQQGSPGGTYVLRTREIEAGSEGAAGTSGRSREGSGADVNGVMLDGDGVYRLIATGNVDIGRNLGKEVAVTGEIANQAQDQTGAGTTGTGSGSQQGSAHDNGRPQRRGTSGEGDAGTNLENGSSPGSGNGRVQGSAPEEAAAGQFFRVTSITKVSDSCSIGGPAGKR